MSAAVTPQFAAGRAAGGGAAGRAAVGSGAGNVLFLRQVLKLIERYARRRKSNSKKLIEAIMASREERPSCITGDVARTVLNVLMQTGDGVLSMMTAMARTAAVAGPDFAQELRHVLTLFEAVTFRAETTRRAFRLPIWAVASIEDHRRHTKPWAGPENAGVLLPGGARRWLNRVVTALARAWLTLGGAPWLAPACKFAGSFAKLAGLVFSQATRSSVTRFLKRMAEEVKANEDRDDLALLNVALAACVRAFKLACLLCPTEAQCDAAEEAGETLPWAKPAGETSCLDDNFLAGVEHTGVHLPDGMTPHGLDDLSEDSLAFARRVMQATGHLRSLSLWLVLREVTLLLEEFPEGKPVADARGPALSRADMRRLALWATRQARHVYGSAHALAGDNFPEACFFDAAIGCASAQNDRAGRWGLVLVRLAEQAVRLATPEDLANGLLKEELMLLGLAGRVENFREAAQKLGETRRACEPRVAGEPRTARGERRLGRWFFTYEDWLKTIAQGQILRGETGWRQDDRRTLVFWRDCVQAARPHLPEGGWLQREADGFEASFTETIRRIDAGMPSVMLMPARTFASSEEAEEVRRQLALVIAGNGDPATERAWRLERLRKIRWRDDRRPEQVQLVLRSVYRSRLARVLAAQRVIEAAAEAAAAEAQETVDETDDADADAGVGVGFVDDNLDAADGAVDAADDDDDDDNVRSCAGEVAEAETIGAGHLMLMSQGEAAWALGGGGGDGVAPDDGFGDGGGVAAAAAGGGGAGVGADEEMARLPEEKTSLAGGGGSAGVELSWLPSQSAHLGQTAAAAAADAAGACAGFGGGVLSRNDSLGAFSFASGSGAAGACAGFGGGVLGRNDSVGAFSLASGYGAPASFSASQGLLERALPLPRGLSFSQLSFGEGGLTAPGIAAAAAGAGGSGGGVLCSQLSDRHFLAGSQLEGQTSHRSVSQAEADREAGQDVDDEREEEGSVAPNASFAFSQDRMSLGGSAFAALVAPLTDAPIGERVGQKRPRHREAEGRAGLAASVGPADAVPAAAIADARGRLVQALQNRRAARGAHLQERAHVARLLRDHLQLLVREDRVPSKELREAAVRYLGVTLLLVRVQRACEAAAGVPVLEAAPGAAAAAVAALNAVDCLAEATTGLDALRVRLSVYAGASAGTTTRDAQRETLSRLALSMEGWAEVEDELDAAANLSLSERVVRAKQKVDACPPPEPEQLPRSLDPDLVVAEKQLADNMRADTRRREYCLWATVAVVLGPGRNAWSGPAMTGHGQTPAARLRGLIRTRHDRPAATECAAGLSAAAEAAEKARARARMAALLAESDQGRAVLPLAMAPFWPHGSPQLSVNGAEPGTPARLAAEVQIAARVLRARDLTGTLVELRSPLVARPEPSVLRDARRRLADRLARELLELRRSCFRARDLPIPLRIARREVMIAAWGAAEAVSSDIREAMSCYDDDDDHQLPLLHGVDEGDDTPERAVLGPWLQSEASEVTRAHDQLVVGNQEEALKILEAARLLSDARSKALLVDHAAILRDLGDQDTARRRAVREAAQRVNALASGHRARLAAFWAEQKAALERAHTGRPAGAASPDFRHCVSAVVALGQ